MSAVPESLSAPSPIKPTASVAKVCALIPPPRFHMVRYHGVLSSHAKVRAEVVPRVEDLPVQLPLFKQERGADRDLDVLAPVHVEPEQTFARAEAMSGSVWLVPVTVVLNG